MDKREDLRQEVERLKRYLQLADIREFTYDVEKDILVNMRYGKECEIFYEGPLSGWEEDYRKNRMDRGGEGNVSSFCDALRAGKDQFEIHFSFKGLTRIIKGVAVQEPGKGKMIYGVLMMGQGMGMTQKAQGSGDLVYKRASDRDPMLNMLNKKAITEYGQRICQQPNCPMTYFVIFDLDNFKIVNDTFGHLYGDEVLVTVTEIINNAVGDKGVVGRLGGDEILIITREIADKAELRPVLREIRSNVESTYKGKMGDISLTCSIGAAGYPEHAGDYNAVMELADKMLYLAKEKGKNRYVIYTPEMHQDLLTSTKEKSEAHSFATAFNKIGIIQYMMEDYLRKGTSSNESAFSLVGDSFKLNEILIVYDEGKIGFRWTPQEISHDSAGLNWIKPDADFWNMFDDNQILIVDGLYSLAKKNPALEKKLQARDIQSALFYKICKKGCPMGYILYAKKSQRQKWSEYELLALSTIAKIFEMSVYQ